MSLDRGTRQYRVTVSHTSATSATSGPIYVTWDALDIWGDLSTDLTTAVTGHSDYISKQTALLTCMNAGVAADDQYGSFDDILADYANAKAKLEGACSSQSSQMFSTSQRVTQARLTAWQDVGNSDYNDDYVGVLGTPQGKRFNAVAGNAAEIKRLLDLATNVETPPNLEFPVYEQVQARSSTPSQTLTDADLVQGTGLDCLPSKVRGGDLTVDNKLRVLNCLVFDTHHSFWVDDADDMRRELGAGGRYAWIGQKASMDWECTLFADGPLPTCRKHDVAYGGLQSFAGSDVNHADASVLDETWNPRNKALADYKMKADISAHGCQQQTLAAWPICRGTNAWVANVYFRGVAYINDRGWPVTNRDIDSIRTTTRFIRCPEPVVPSVSDVSVRKSSHSLIVHMNYSPGCVNIPASDVVYVVRWKSREPLNNFV